MKARSAVSIGLLALAFSFSVSAAGPLPVAVKENGITYLSGGFDPEEALAMQAEARSYPLRLVFSAGERDESLADVKVTIEDTAGKVLLDAVSTGPIMLVRLPAGRYTIRAVKSSPDIGLQLSVQVTAQSAERLDFHWPQA